MEAFAAGAGLLAQFGLWRHIPHACPRRRGGATGAAPSLVGKDHPGPPCGRGNRRPCSGGSAAQDQDIGIKLERIRLITGTWCRGCVECRGRRHSGALLGSGGMGRKRIIRDHGSAHRSAVTGTLASGNRGVVPGAKESIFRAIAEESGWRADGSGQGSRPSWKPRAPLSTTILLRSSAVRARTRVRARVASSTARAVELWAIKQIGMIRRSRRQRSDGVGELLLDVQRLPAWLGMPRRFQCAGCMTASGCPSASVGAQWSTSDSSRREVSRK